MHVPGDGPVPSRAMLVGEAPGYTESQTGIPFSGKSGKELSRYLQLGGLQREALYVTNLCKYQPPYINGKQQAPSKEDIERDTPELIQELLDCRPRWIGAVGRYAARWLTGLDLSMEEAHGLAYPIGERIQKLLHAREAVEQEQRRPVSAPEHNRLRASEALKWVDRCRIIPVYHPASALHNTELAPFVWWDLQQFGKYVLGRLQPPTIADEHPQPDYDVFTDSMRRPDGSWIGTDVRSLFSPDPEWVAIDTEGLLPPHGTPWGLSISNAPGMARVISVNDRQQLALLNTLIARSKCWIIFHNALHDVPILEAMGVRIPWARVQDTMLMLFTLRLLALGLKPTSRRLSGMTMRSYEEVIRPAERSIALDYIQRAVTAKLCVVCNGTGKVPAYGKVKPKELRRLVTRRQQPHDVYIGRPSKWGNPFVIGKDGTRAVVIAKYEDWLRSQPALMEEARAELKGKVLACYCAPQPCHGDVLARIANASVLKRLDKCGNCVDGGLWPEREGQLKWDWQEARWKTTKGWEIGRYLRTLRQDIEAGVFEQATGDDDVEADDGQERKPKTIRERWESWDEDVREPVEELIGEMPQATLNDIPFPDARDYSARDADATIRNYPKIKAMVDDMGLYEAYRLDLSVIPAAAEMQRNGMKITRSGFERLSRKLRRENDLIATELRQLTGRSINPASGDQVAGYLFGERKLEFTEQDERELTAAWSLGLPSEKQTKTGKRAATDDKTLNGLLLKYADRPEVTRPVRLFLDHRMRHKLITSYADKMWRYADANDRVHPRVKPVTAATFRWAMADPALQTIPTRTELGRLVRQCFIAEEGNVLGSADFDQIELRVLAALSGDADLIRVFRDGLDPHIMGASKIWRIPYEELAARVEAGDKKAKEMRASAKNINFGIVYGITARGLKAQMDLRGEKWTIDECQDLIDTYLRTLFPGIGAFIVDSQDEARSNGYVRSEMGHVRYLPGVWSSIPSIKAEAERQAGNFRIQTTAAEILKLAVRDLMERGKHTLDAISVMLLLSLHDEVVFECPADDRSKDIAAAVVETYMTNPLTLPHGVQITAAVKYADNWGDLKFAEDWESAA